MPGPEGFYAIAIPGVTDVLNGTAKGVALKG